MEGPFRIWDRVYMIGSAEISHGMDCCVYLIDAGELVMLDAGAGKSTGRLMDSIVELGFRPEQLTTLILTHAHIDHIGSAAELHENYNLNVIAHTDDSVAIETGKKVGAEYYGARYRPCKVDTKLTGQINKQIIGSLEFQFLHIPGHTPGSMAVIIETSGVKVLFGQDIHGPYMPTWGGDPNVAAESLESMIQLDADILCEGHYGVIKPATAVKQFIREFKDSLRAR